MRIAPHTTQIYDRSNLAAPRTIFIDAGAMLRFDDGVARAARTIVGALNPF